MCSQTIQLQTIVSRDKVTTILELHVSSYTPFCMCTQQGDSVQTGNITNRGQSPIGGCVFKLNVPVGLLSFPHIHTILIGDTRKYTFSHSPRKKVNIFFNSLGVIRGQGTQVQHQRKPGTLPNRGQSPIGGCVFKQMSPLVGVYKRILPEKWVQQQKRQQHPLPSVCRIFIFPIDVVVPPSLIIVIVPPPSPADRGPADGRE